MNNFNIYFCKVITLTYWFNSLYPLCCLIKNNLNCHFMVLLCCQYNIISQITSIYFSIISISRPILITIRWLQQWNSISSYLCLCIPFKNRNIETRSFNIFSNLADIYVSTVGFIWIILQDYHHQKIHLTCNISSNFIRHYMLALMLF